MQKTVCAAPQVGAALVHRSSRVRGAGRVGAPVALIAAAFALASGCGLGDRDLPGHILTSQVDLVDLNWVSYLHDPHTGQATALPLSSTNPDSAKDRWVSGSNKDALVRFDETGEGVAVFDRATLTRRSVFAVDDISEPALSPDGRYILALWYDRNIGEVSTDRTLTVFDAETGEVIEWGSLQPLGYAYERSYAWLPDGSYIYMVDRTVYRTRPLEAGAAVLAELDLPEASTTTINSYALAVSPNGSRLAVAWDGDRDRPGDTNIWVANIDGSGLHRVTAYADLDQISGMTHSMPAWSPDGRWLAFVRYLGGVVTAPVDSQNPFSGSRVVAAGCSDQVLVLDADSEDISFTWPLEDTTYGVEGTSPDGRPIWLGTCGGSVSWVN